jgi:tRNA(adenine34) deaminase
VGAFRRAGPVVESPDLGYNLIMHQPGEQNTLSVRIESTGVEAMVGFEEHEHWMREALAEATHALTAGDVPVGAVAVRAGRVVGRGYNRKEAGRDPTAHAEMLALQEAARTLDGWRLPGVTLYCTLEPCPMCAGAMIQARLSRLVYAVDDPKTGAAGSVVDLLRHEGLNHRVEIVKGVLSQEAQTLLQAFFEGLRDGSIPRTSAA